jgi:hypothetical protein
VIRPVVLGVVLTLVIKIGWELLGG